MPPEKTEELTPDAPPRTYDPDAKITHGEPWTEVCTGAPSAIIRSSRSLTVLEARKQP
jgi:hypothetical protein